MPGSRKAASEAVASGKRARSSKAVGSGKGAQSSKAVGSGKGAQSSEAVASGKGARSSDAVAVEHLRAADPVLRGVIDDVGVDGLGDPRAGRPSDPYGALVRSIVGQQLSTRSARAIYGRLIDRFGGRTPTPAEVLADDPEELRTSAGLSHAKVNYLRSLAGHVLDGSLQLEGLDKLSDDQVTSELVAVRGIGVWSAQLFLMFQLGRPDILASGDLGIRRAVMVRYGLKSLPAPPELEAIAEPWRPYRTMACRFLWRSMATTPVGG